MSFNRDLDPPIKLVTWAGHMSYSNRFLYGVLSDSDPEWVTQKPGTISVPKFIKLRAKGRAKMVNGRVLLKRQ